MQGSGLNWTLCALWWLFWYSGAVLLSCKYEFRVNPKPRLTAYDPDRRRKQTYGCWIMESYCSLRSWQGKLRRLHDIINLSFSEPWTTLLVFKALCQSHIFVTVDPAGVLRVLLKMIRASCNRLRIFVFIYGGTISPKQKTREFSPAICQLQEHTRVRIHYRKTRKCKGF